jgi:hypothetical protein
VLNVSVTTKGSVAQAESMLAGPLLALAEKVKSTLAALELNRS